VLCAFDLLELDGEDLRRTPIEERKRTLAKLLSHPQQSSPWGHRLQRAYTGDGAIIFEHACALGCEGIVSNRLGSPYRSGRTDHWVKVKNLEALSRARPRKAGADKSQLLRRKDKRPSKAPPLP
jgi:bifunctional non-homologous end joining protein LigD